MGKHLNTKTQQASVWLDSVFISLQTDEYHYEEPPEY